MIIRLFMSIVLACCLLTDPTPAAAQSDFTTDARPGRADRYWGLSLPFFVSSTGFNHTRMNLQGASNRSYGGGLQLFRGVGMFQFGISAGVGRVHDKRPFKVRLTGDHTVMTGYNEYTTYIGGGDTRLEKSSVVYGWLDLEAGVFPFHSRKVIAGALIGRRYPGALRDLQGSWQETLHVRAGFFAGAEVRFIISTRNRGYTGLQVRYLRFRGPVTRDQMRLGFFFAAHSGSKGGSAR